MWVSIALLAGSLIVAQHDTEEACQGRKAMLMKEKSITKAECVNMNQTIGYSTTLGNWCTRGNGTSGPCSQ